MTLITFGSRRDDHDVRGKKIRPENEIAAAKQRLASAKRMIRLLIVEIDSLFAEVKWGSPDDDDTKSVDVENVGCSRCQSFDSTDNNDIIMCDRQGCFRAWHVKCAELTEDDISDDPDEDWFCPLCCCIQKCIDQINEAFEKDYGIDRWHTVFDSDDDEPDDTPEHAAGTILAAQLDDEDENDSDFESSKESEDDATSLSNCTGDDPSTLEREARPNKVVVEDINERNIIHHPRPKKAIDYVTLNQALIAVEGFQSSDGEDDEWS